MSNRPSSLVITRNTHSTHPSLFAVIILRPDVTCQPEVSNFHDEIISDEHITRGKISMNALWTKCCCHARQIKRPILIMPWSGGNAIKPEVLVRKFRKRLRATLLALIGVYSLLFIIMLIAVSESQDVLQRRNYQLSTECCKFFVLYQVRIIELLTQHVIRDHFWIPTNLLVVALPVCD